MERRRFLRATALGAASTILGIAPSLAATAQPQLSQEDAMTDQAVLTSPSRQRMLHTHLLCAVPSGRCHGVPRTNLRGPCRALPEVLSRRSPRKTLLRHFYQFRDDPELAGLMAEFHDDPSSTAREGEAYAKRLMAEW
jgi:hypothetical protein